MTGTRLVIRSLIHYRRTGLVVAFGVAVATAVIVGSLLAGDSVEASTRAVTLARLGEIDVALTAPRFFEVEVARRLADHPAAREHASRVVPVILAEGALTAPDTGITVPRVNVIGVDDVFWELYPGGARPTVDGTTAAMNAALAADLDVERGARLELRADRPNGAPHQTLFGHRDPQKTTAPVRLAAGQVLDDGRSGDFSLSPQTETPRNLFVDRAWLAQRIDTEGQVNALLIAGRDAEPAPAELTAALSDAAGLHARGQRLEPNPDHGYLSLESRTLLLTDRMAEAARAAAADTDGRAALTSIYLAETVRLAQGDETASISYAVAAGVEPLGPSPIWPVEPGEAVLNRWAASDLGAEPGDRIEVTWLVPGIDEEYVAKSDRFEVTEIAELEGPTADPGLVPTFPGITDADTVGEWDIPFPLDQPVTERDEEYWDRYGPTPKLFVSLDDTRRMWGDSAEGRWLTSVRVAPENGSGLEAYRDRFERALLDRFSAGEAGLVFRPVRREALEASRGSTDFRGLFLGMSMFLVVSGAALAGMLMRLSVERRAAEMGTLRACGVTERRAGRLILAEGAVLSAVGAAAGVPLGALYAYGVIAGLQTWWTGAVAGAALWLHVGLGSLLIGLAAGLAAGLLSVWWGVRLLRRRRALDLLAGWRALGATGVRPGSTRMLAAAAVGSLVIAAVLVLFSAVVPALEPPVAFFGSGAALLVAGLAGCALVLGGALGRRGNRVSLFRLTVRNAAAHRGRSMLAVGLLACATFVIVTVAANERDYGRMDPTRRESGTGGFTLRAISSLPLRHDPARPAGRARLGFTDEDEDLMRDVRVYGFLLSSGEDISCLNLARPQRPTVLGVSDRMIERGGFIVRTEDPAENPWTLLGGGNDGPAPAFADSESAQWQLHKGLGDTLTIPTEGGDEVELRFRGLISASFLASEVLVAEADFRRIAPSETAPRFFLIETPAEKTDAVADLWRRRLGGLGVEVRRTDQILNDLIGVQNTYLMTFLTLGGLGLLLGTVGLVVVLLRNALERRAEFALMLATGFERRHLALLLVAENAGLLAAGLACGTVAALAAVAPHLASLNSNVNWPALAGVLGGIFLVGLAACALMAAASVRGPVIDALRNE